MIIERFLSIFHNIEIAGSGTKIMKGNTRPLLFYCLIFFLLLIGSFLFQGTSATNIIKSGSDPSEGQSPYCLSFDGNSYVYCGQSQIFQTQNFTIEAWIKPEYNIYTGSDSLYGHQYGDVISFTGTGDSSQQGGWWLQFNYSNGQLYFNWRYYEGSWPWQFRVYPTNKAVWYNDTWYNIEVTFDSALPSDNLKFYVNGVLDAEFSDPYPTIRYATSQPLQIGGGAYGNYSGLIDEVRIWNYSLTQSEIQSMISRTLSSDEALDPNLLGYWPFDEGTGSITKDYSSYGNDGILSASSATPQWFSPGCPISFVNLTTITFIQTGLPQGSEWSVNLNGVTKSSTNSNLTFNMSEGSYFYTIGDVTGYMATPSSGSVTVNGIYTNITIPFTKSWILPSSPMNLSAAGVLNAIILQWGPPNNNGAPPSFSGSGIESYHIYRGTSSSSEKYYDTVNGTILTYADNSVSPGIVYFYEVTAINPVGESGFSNEASGQEVLITPPSPPLDLIAVPQNNGIYLQFDQPSSDGGSPITQYLIYKGTQHGSETLFLTLSANETDYLDTNVLPGEAYYYFIVADNTAGTSNPSNGAAAVAPIGAPSWWQIMFVPSIDPLVTFTFWILIIGFISLIVAIIFRRRL